MKPIYHIAAREDWQRAERDGEYTISTRGRTLAQQGFIHCSDAGQVAGVANFIYQGATDLVLLVIDPERVTSRVQYDEVPGQPAPYPHIYGPLNTEAVVAVSPFAPGPDGIFREPDDAGSALHSGALHLGLVRFVFAPPATEAAGLLTLPWAEPLEDWADERLVVIRQRGISRHVVRFVSDNGIVYALKAISERLARREYRLLRALLDAKIPAVEVVGIAVDRGPDSDAILVTRFLTYATTYRAVFSSPRGVQPTDVLLDALVELLVRLHLTGFFWGDCSLSNTLFRYDAGMLEAYLVDAETSELHPEGLSRGQREYDLDLATERVFGELLDLQAGELLPENVDPLEIAEELRRRYENLWHELTTDEILRPDEQRYRIAERLRRLNELGFDAEEVELVSTPEGNRLHIKTRVAESGQHSRRLFLRTGIDAGDNQARRLLNDIASYRAYLEQKKGHPVSEVVAANGWLEEVYDPVIAAIPDSLRDRLPPAELFHEILEHRWYASEAAGRDIGTTAAARSYFEQVLPEIPKLQIS